MKYKRLLSLSMFALLLAVPQSALADGAALDVVEDASSQASSDAAPVKANNDGWSAASVAQGVGIDIPKDPSAPISITETNGPEFNISLPTSSKAGDGQRAGEGAVVYPNDNGSASVIVPMEKGIVSLNTVISSPSAPQEYAYKIDISGSGWLMLENDGSVLLLDGKNTPHVYFAPPWAKDANGKEIPTHYRIEGTTLIQVVEHRSGDYAYPVAADPEANASFFGIGWPSMIDSVRRVQRGRYITYEVRPTRYGRAASNLEHKSFGWPQAVKKGVPEWGKLRMQYLCHPYSFIARAKSSWNLDLWRPNVSPGWMAYKLCNP